MNQKVTPYDRTDEFNVSLRPKIDEIKKICNRLKIPIYISVCYKNNNKGSLYYNDMVGSWTNGIVLRDDYFPDYVNIQNGFKTVPPHDGDEIDMSDFTFDVEE